MHRTWPLNKHSCSKSKELIYSKQRHFVFCWVAGAVMCKWSFQFSSTKFCGVNKPLGGSGSRRSVSPTTRRSVPPLDIYLSPNPWYTCRFFLSKNFPTDPWSIPQIPNQQFMVRNSFHLGVWGCLGYAPGVCWSSLRFLQTTQPFIWPRTKRWWLCRLILFWWICLWKRKPSWLINQWFPLIRPY